MKTRWMLALAILGLLSLSRASTGALVVNSGDLHASATAFNNPNSATDAPPGKPLVLPSTSIVADAMASGIYSTTAHGHADATVGQNSDGVITIDTHSLITNTIDNGSITSATAETTGTISFTETEEQKLPWTFSMQDFFGDGSVIIQNSANAAVLSVSNVGSPDDRSGVATMAPDAYTIRWYLRGQLSTSVGGASSMQFSLVPEPDLGIGMAFLAMAPCRRRR